MVILVVDGEGLAVLAGSGGMLANDAADDAVCDPAERLDELHEAHAGVAL